MSVHPKLPKWAENLYNRKVTKKGPSDLEVGSLLNRDMKTVPALSNNSSPGGEGNKMNTMDYANAGLGVAAIARNLFSKRPTMKEPEKLDSFIRPAQGDEDALARKQNAIAEQTRSATRDINQTTGSDVSSNVAARLGIQANANDAENAALSENAAIKRADENRVEQAINRDRQINHDLMQVYNDRVFNAEYADYIRRDAEGKQTFNNSLNYENQRQADLRNKAFQERLTNQNIDMLKAAQLYDAQKELIRQGRTAEDAKAEAPNLAYDFGQYKTNFYGRK
jgi:carboxylesterase type B